MRKGGEKWEPNLVYIRGKDYFCCQITELITYSFLTWKEIMTAMSGES
jgi:hypothetical protein